MSKKDNTLVVIGAGAAGMIAAWQASLHGTDVIVLEKNAKPGIKILISGGGKCNITNAADIRTMLKQFRPNEGRFLKFAFHEFSNTELLSLLHSKGVPTYARENGKVFPESHDAEDVVDALREVMEHAGAVLKLQSPVKELFANADGSFNVQTGREIIRARSVIIASGGMSYQKTGTSGDGYRWLTALGHTLVPSRPALAPIYLTPPPPSAWQGTPVRDCSLTAYNGDTPVSSWTGDVLITHQGLSGPAALEVSRSAAEAMERGTSVTLGIDFFPELDLDALDRKLQTESTAAPSRSIVTMTEHLVPQRMAEFVVTLSGIPLTTKLNQLQKKQRRALAVVLKRCELGTAADIPLDRGEVTAGGVTLNDVEPTTMESKKRQGLYLCGEILDIAGPVGGYNLQAAFSTGFVAGRSAALRHQR